jgi:monoamine oxidase
LDVLKMPFTMRIEAALRSLASVTGMTQSHLAGTVRSAHGHDWVHDPFTLGAYTYVPAGALNAVEALAHPCDGTLFFAGEATDTSGHIGTVHGAIASGRRAAAELLRGIS